MDLREELARDIFFADNHKAPQDHLQQEWVALTRATLAVSYAHAIADGLIAKGYGKLVQQ